MQTTTLMKVLSGLLMMVFFGTLHAQDIIITKDAQKIEAKILEVSNSEIKYKKQSNLEGPTFILGVEELNSIIYANGEVQVLEEQKEFVLETEVSAEELEKGVTPRNCVDQNENFLGKKITRYKDNTYYIDGVQMSEKEYLEFVKNKCPIAYDYHMDGIKKVKLGKTFCGLAAGFTVASFSLLYVGSVFMLFDEMEILLFSGIGCALAADCFIAASIPLWVAGAKKKQSSYRFYNEQSSSNLSLNLQSSKNGFGLALRF